jgi:hypothetical protein
MSLDSILIITLRTLNDAYHPKIQTNSIVILPKSPSSLIQTSRRRQPAVLETWR